MTTHIPTHSIPELRAWLPTFQEELISDFHADDDTRRPCYYTIDYQETTSGWDKDSADDYGVYNAYTAAVETPEYTAQQIIDDDPDWARELAEENEAGFVLLNGMPMLADRDEFIEWLQESLDASLTYTVLGLRSQRQSIEHIIHLTRVAARDNLQHLARKYNNAHTYAHHTHWSPDLEKLLELIYALDLDKSTLVFRTHRNETTKF